MGFPGSSAGKESACNAGDPGSFPGSGSSPGEEIGYPLQCSWASLVAQKVKNLPVTWEIWVRSLGWEDPLEKGMATRSVLLPGESHGQRSLVSCSPQGHKEVDTAEWLTFTGLWAILLPLHASVFSTIIGHKDTLQNWWLWWRLKKIHTFWGT